MKRADLTGRWDVDIGYLVGLIADIETHDGAVRRNARISGLRMRELQVNGETWPVPFAIELNDDGADVLPLEHLKRMELYER